MGGTYYDSACAGAIQVVSAGQKSCEAMSMRRLAAHGNSSSTSATHETMVCEGGTAVTELEISTPTTSTITADISSLDTPAKKRTLVQATADGVLEAFNDVQTEGTNSIKSA